LTRIAAIYRWDLMQGLQNRFLQVFAVVCVMGGTALLAASPGPETLPLVLIQAILFFGSLFAFLVGWGSGQQARAQGAFLFAQPLGAGELVAGKLLGTGTWSLLLLLLFMGPAALRSGMPETILALGALAAGLLLVCVLAGLLIGLIAAPVSGLLAVLLAWAVTVAGWELGLLVLSEAAWMARMPGVFVTLLLLNPAGAFRVGAMIGLEAVPFDASELDTGRTIFAHIMLVAGGVFAVWLAALFAAAAWALGRQEF
jgi:hypothetical protein